MEQQSTIFHWQSRGTAWKGVGIYHLTMAVCDRSPLLGTLVIPNNEPMEAFVEPTAFGRSVTQCFYDMSKFHPEVQPLQYQVMPDHFHGVIRVTREMPVGILTVIRGFWQGCKKSADSYFPLDVVQQKKRIFSEMPFIRPLVRKGQLQSMIHYVQLNPQRLATKRLRPGFFRVQHGVEVNGRVYDAVGNIALLLEKDRDVVHVHKELVWNAEKGDTAPLRNYMNGCVLKARKGCVMVSPFISPKERDVLAVLIKEGRSIIYLVDNGFGEYYKPHSLIFDACAAGKVLIMSPWKYDDNKGQITRSECIALNNLAEEIAFS